MSHNTKSTDLDRNFAEAQRDNRQFSKDMIIYWASGFLLGCLIGAFLILGVLKMFVG